ncbi:site-2 protease family protein [Salimicrobium halophilum]|uniref:Sporulation factor SpoIVFB. Metallo peptidase. MEROPS family M50B n=1 Tax=Salimicrobium halophilum TaxID=86666 RepID=A0A1G8PKD4_9BACI|nr:site-2 protease family protein [Salimicrobium halophilum]SDI92796.1 sporulation factor SpoIVFB. Metallo peptidase. MEROPS family M50B [Salimicrobium halophilum]
MKTIKGKVALHPLFFLLTFTAFVTGHFLFFISVLLIIIIHELGHVAVARLFEWKIEKVELWLFGATMVSDDFFFRPWHEKVLVTIAGPLQHLWIGMLIPHLGLGGAWEETLLFYNTWLAVFNLLPIWPLDGGKLMWILLSSLLSFWTSFRTVLLGTGVVMVLFLICFPFFFTIALFFVFLGKEIYEQWKHQYYLHVRFLFYCLKRETAKEKWMDIPPDTKVKEGLKKLRLGRGMVFKSGSEVIREKECIRSYFDHPTLRFLDLHNR